jgi:hypothetical protein
MELPLHPRKARKNSGTCELRVSDKSERVALGLAAPDDKAGEDRGDALRQLFDAQSFGGVMTRRDQADADGFGFKRAVKTSLARQ